MKHDPQMLANLMGMAGTAERAQNNEEAISYYNRVLEADPTYSEAWLGKGRAAGWLSTLTNVRVNETIVAFGHAIATVEEEYRSNTAERAKVDLNGIVAALYGMARRHFEEHGAVPNARQTYIAVTAQLLDALTGSAAWKTDDRAALEQIVLMTRQLLDLGVADSLKKILREQMDEAITRLRAIDPSYSPPALAQQTIVEREQAKATSDAWGYIVLFIVVVIGAFVTAATRH